MLHLKNKLVIGLLISGLFSLNSCNDVLDIEPTSELENSFFNSEERMQRGVGAAYAAMANIYGPQLNDNTQHTFWLLPGDDLAADGTGNSLETFSGLTGANNRVEGMWRRHYAIISRCNFILDKIDLPEVVSVYRTQGRREANKGEMLFLRSYSFYRLWDWFRKAPIQDQRIRGLDQTLLEPSAGFEMLDNAIASLEEAANLLPVSWDQQNLGRITKDGAYGLLVKAYTLRANYNGNNTADYAKAIAAFEKISGSRQLVPFGDNFDFRKENNAESLFEFQASFAPAQDNAWLSNDFGGDVGQMGAYYQYNHGHWGNYSTGVIGPSQKLINAFDPNDPRRGETFTSNANNLGGVLWWVAPRWNRFGGYQLVKYTNGERGNNYDRTWQLSSANNTRIIRLADVKLTVAEAYFATGNTAAALKQVNDVRERARKSTPDGREAAAPLALSSVRIQDIMNERFLELAGEEGHRWTDLRRWHAAGYINLANWSAADFGFSFNPSLFAFNANIHLVFPIPNSELDRNPKMAASGQHPGY